jgi:hypothetical protein
MKKIDRSRRGQRDHTEKDLGDAPFNRDPVLKELHEMLESMSVKVVKGRVRDPKVFDLKLRALKAFAYGASVFSSVLDAKENELILRRLDRLEAPTGKDNHD